MATLSQLQTQVYAMLGTTSSDRAFPATAVTQWLNDAFNALLADLPGAFLTKRATLAADGGTGRVYTLSTQSTAITDLRQFRDVRTVDRQGVQLEIVDYDDLETWQGNAYAVYGPDASVVLETSRTVADASALAILYAYWPPALSAAGDVPGGIPDRFHDLIALGAAELAFTSGGEGMFPQTYARKQADRHAQFRHHCGQRGGSPSRQRVRDEASTW